MGGAEEGEESDGEWLAQQLEGYGMRPRTMRIGNERAEGYEWDDFRGAFRRYIPRSELERLKADVKEEGAKAEEKPGSGPEGGAGGKAGEGELPR